MSDNAEYYCPEHKYNPPENSGFCFCPQCESADSALADALKSVLLLIEDGVLVRDTSKDADFKQYMNQALRITTTLKNAHAVLASASEPKP